MTNKEKMEQLAEIFETTEFTPETQLDTLAWDSMAMLSVIAVAKASGKAIKGMQLREAVTVGDLLALM